MKNSTEKRKKTGRAWMVPVVLGVTLFSYTSQSDDVASMADALARIRIEVEGLSEAVAAKRDDAKNQLRALASQKSELEMERGREEMRLKQLQVAKAKRAEQLVGDSERDEKLAPVVADATDVIDSQIKRSLPFKREERLVAVDDIRRKQKEGMLRSTDAVARLWDRVEDELRLSSENGLYKQVIEVDGEEMLAEVVRIGMVMLYFKTKDGKVGKAEKQGDRWTFRSFTDSEDKKQVLMLFDAFKKQIRVGFFALPNALPVEEDAP